MTPNRAGRAPTPRPWTETRCLSPSRRICPRPILKRPPSPILLRAGATGRCRESETEPTDDEEPEWVNGDGHLTMPDEAATSERKPREIAVVLVAGDDPEKDGRKLKRIHNILIKYPGIDSFKIIIRRGASDKTLKFPQAYDRHLRRAPR